MQVRTFERSLLQVWGVGPWTSDSMQTNTSRQPPKRREKGRFAHLFTVSVAGGSVFGVNLWHVQGLTPQSRTQQRSKARTFTNRSDYSPLHILIFTILCSSRRSTDEPVADRGSLRAGLAFHGETPPLVIAVGDVSRATNPLASPLRRCDGRIANRRAARGTASDGCRSARLTTLARSADRGGTASDGCRSARPTTLARSADRGGTCSLVRRLIAGHSTGGRAADEICYNVDTNWRRISAHASPMMLKPSNVTRHRQ